MKTRLIYTASLTVLAASLSFACGNGDDDDTTSGTDAGTTTDSSSSPPADTGTGTSAATFTEVYSQIIGPICSGCHGDGTGASSGKLVMDTQADAYTALVGVAAAGAGCASSGETRVVAGDSASSLIWQKVSMTKPPCGSQMPLGGTPLSSAEVQLIADWIDDGAQNN
jgi:hypothetical protein